MEMRVLLTFDTTHHALWAEEVVGGCGLACEIVPAPAAATARCNLALELLPEEMVEAETALREAGVPFERYVEA
jgi:hypothetical protein